MKGPWALAAAGVALCLIAVVTTTAQAASENGSGMIVFSSNRSGPWRIWTVRPDGTELSELTKADPDEHDVDPAFSPDGKQILFSSTRGGTVGVWKMSADGSQREADLRRRSGRLVARRGKSIVFRRKERLFTRELATGRGDVHLARRLAALLRARRGARTAKRSPLPAGGTPATRSSSSAPKAASPSRSTTAKGPASPAGRPTESGWCTKPKRNVAAVNPDGKKNRPGHVVRRRAAIPPVEPRRHDRSSSARAPPSAARGSSTASPSQGGTPVKITEGGSDMNPDWK